MAPHPQRISRRTMLLTATLGSLSQGYLTQRLLASDDTSGKGGRDRHTFVMQLAKVRDEDTKETVLGLLGQADDVRRAPDPVPYPTDEIWCYGSDGHGTLATLGKVCFRNGRVVWVAGRDGQPPAPNAINEDELCEGMRYLHPGPEAAGYNDPLQLVRVANYLRPRGKTKALAIIGEYGRIRDVSVDETWLFLLLRTLFEVPSPPRHMPDMLIGAMSPKPPKERTRIPRFPIVIVHDIPFSLLWGVNLAGEAQPISQHVDYFQKHGTIRARDLRPPDDPYPSFQKLLASKEWAYMVEAEGNRSVDIAGHTLLQLLALGRTAYDPPEARQPFAYPKTSDYDRHHKLFLSAGARWDDKLQLYIRKDGTHEKVGHLKNIYK